MRAQPSAVPDTPNENEDILPPTGIIDASLIVGGLARTAASMSTPGGASSAGANPESSGTTVGSGGGTSHIPTSPWVSVNASLRGPGLTKNVT